MTENDTNVNRPTIYTAMTDDEFREILEEIVDEERSTILSIGDVYTTLAEHFNNEVLERWTERNEEKAFPWLFEDPKDEEETNGD